MNAAIFLKRCRMAAVESPHADDWPECDQDALVGALEMRLASIAWENKMLTDHLHSAIRRLAATKRISQEQAADLMLKHTTDVVAKLNEPTRGA